MSNYGNAHAHTVVSSEEAVANRELMQPQRGARERELLQVACSSPSSWSDCTKPYHVPG